MTAAPTSRPEAADGVVVDGAVVDGTARVEPVDGKPGVLVTVGERRVEVIRREEHVALRVRDPQAPTLQRFSGVPAFPVDASWVVTGRFEPWDAPQRIDVDTVIDGLGFHPTAVGTVRFTVGGAEQELVALAGQEGELKLHFRDGTSGHSTYGGGRTLSTDEPAAGRHRADRPQPHDQPAVRVQRVRDLPAAAGGQRRHGARRGGGEDPGLTPGSFLRPPGATVGP